MGGGEEFHLRRSVSTLPQYRLFIQNRITDIESRGQNFIYTVQCVRFQCTDFIFPKSNEKHRKQGAKFHLYRSVSTLPQYRLFFQNRITDIENRGHNYIYTVQ